MKPDIHPKLNPVVFVDASSGQEFISRSTMSSKQTKDVNGVEHYVIRLDISSTSHPFWTGSKQRGNAKEGRVELFNRRFKKKKEG